MLDILFTLDITLYALQQIIENFKISVNIYPILSHTILALPVVSSNKSHR